MTDIVERLAENSKRAESPIDALAMNDAAAEIRRLRAKVAKADALADVCNELSQEAYGYEWHYETTFHRDVHEKLERAVAAYREGSDT